MLVPFKRLGFDLTLKPKSARNPFTRLLPGSLNTDSATY